MYIANADLLAPSLCKDIFGLNDGQVRVPNFGLSDTAIFVVFLMSPI